jgi:hypothetical protein
MKKHLDQIVSTKAFEAIIEKYKLRPDDDDPPISLAGARRVVNYCRNVTNALLDDPRVWGGVERLAKALYRRRYLSPRAVKKVLGDAYFADAGRTIRDSQFQCAGAVVGCAGAVVAYHQYPPSGRPRL